MQKYDWAGNSHCGRIFGIVLPAEINFAARGVKTINFSRSGVVVGNHYHTIESGRIEVYIGIGAPGVELFNFAYRDGGEIKERIIFNGDSCFIPPGCTHSFKVLSENASLWGFSNLEGYDPAHDEKDVILT